MFSGFSFALKKDVSVRGPLPSASSNLRIFFFNGQFDKEKIAFCFVLISILLCASSLGLRGAGLLWLRSTGSTVQTWYLWHVDWTASGRWGLPD